MRPALVVARRELAQLFHSPLAYVFLALFVVVVKLPFVLAVFPFGVADPRLFFDTLPWCLALFASLVTMRSWAEERQENTYEMLLTFPMRERHLVAGKFVASFSFLLLGLACTLTIPWMLYDLGSPDTGVIVSGYAGAVLLAAMWSAAGIFVSGFTRSQLLAALFTVVYTLFSLFLGTEQVATILDARFGGVGTFTETMVGAWSHYSAFEKGVVEVADVAYFLAWTAAFLWLNTLFVSLRHTPRSGGIFAAAVVMALGSAMLVGRLSVGSSWARADLTEDGLYTLSPGTARILSRPQVPVRVTFYVSPRDEMPREFQTLEREVMDRLQEMSVASGGKLVVRATHARPDKLVGTEEPATEDEDPEKALAEAEKGASSLEKRLSAKGIRPFAVSSAGVTESSIRLVYATLAVGYREKEEEYLQPIRPERLADLEYLLANTVARLVRARPPKIALHLGPQPMDPQLRQMYQQANQPVPDPYAQVEELLRRERFDVERVGLTAREPLPEDYDALAVVGPVDLHERQRWEIDRALAEGKPTLLAVQRTNWEFRRTQRGIQPTLQEVSPGLDEVLEPQGLGVAKAILLDENTFELRLRTGGVEDLLGGTPVRLPTNVLVKEESMSGASVISERLPSVVYLWGSPLALEPARLTANGISTTTLFTSGPRSWSLDVDAFRRRPSFTPPADTQFGALPLAVHAKGRFVSAFAGKERPKWPFRMEDVMRDGRPTPAPPDPPAEALRPADGQLILIGCANLWRDEYLGALGDAGLLLNCLDALTLDEDLLLVRSRQPTDRRFNKPSDARARFWSVAPFGSVILALLSVGTAIWRVRLTRRERWVAQHGREA